MEKVLELVINGEEIMVDKWVKDSQQEHFCVCGWFPEQEYDHCLYSFLNYSTKGCERVSEHPRMKEIIANPEDFI